VKSNDTPSEHSDVVVIVNLIIGDDEFNVFDTQRYRQASQAKGTCPERKPMLAFE
jgi:hypothetical protein